eukprot:scaffold62294_cov26-Attheya_sp.AAC.1
MAKKLSMRATRAEPVALRTRSIDITCKPSSKKLTLFWFWLSVSPDAAAWRRCWVEIMCEREMEMDGLDGAKELQNGADATRRGSNLAREIINYCFRLDYSCVCYY